MAAMQVETTVKDLQQEIDMMLRRREPLIFKKLRRVAITDANIRRLFGVSMEELFRILAEKLGYEMAT